MKIGDLVRWAKSNVPGAQVFGKLGIVIGKSGVFYNILWSDGTRNGNVEWQMEVVSESG